MKNVSCKHDRLNGWNSTLQAPWYIRRVQLRIIWFLWTNYDMTINTQFYTKYRPRFMKYIYFLIEWRKRGFRLSAHTRRVLPFFFLRIFIFTRTDGTPRGFQKKTVQFFFLFLGTIINAVGLLSWILKLGTHSFEPQQHCCCCCCKLLLLLL